MKRCTTVPERLTLPTPAQRRDEAVALAHDAVAADVSPARAGMKLMGAT